MNWYGRPVFNAGNLLASGENSIEIRYTTVLSNYCMSLTGNPTAARWTEGFEKIPVITIFQTLSERFTTDN